MKITLKNQIVTPKFNIIFPAGVELNAIEIDGEFSIQHRIYTSIWVSRISKSKINEIINS